ncbi:MAG TPA: hypothetical protein DCY79_25345 [Planctomycetaceae bacterium]|nr:hypothetical protein [Planctomycetaceae bacterium]
MLHRAPDDAPRDGLNFTMKSTRFSIAVAPMRSSTVSLDMTIGNAGSAGATASLNDHNAAVTIADGSFKSISRDCGVQIWRVSLLPADKQYDNGIRTQTPDVCTQHPFKPAGTAGYLSRNGAQHPAFPGKRRLRLTGRLPAVVRLRHLRAQAFAKL